MYMQLYRKKLKSIQCNLHVPFPGIYQWQCKPQIKYPAQRINNATGIVNGPILSNLFKNVFSYKIAGFISEIKETQQDTDV